MEDARISREIKPETKFHHLVEFDLSDVAKIQPHFAIGPSYLMKNKIYQREDGLERVRQYEIMPLLEDLFYGQRDLADLYGLDSLRKAIARK